MTWARHSFLDNIWLCAPLVRIFVSRFSFFDIGGISPGARWQGVCAG
jgi:hypothetical protein